MSGVMDSVNARTQLVGQNRLELLLFGLEAEQVYGINVFKVREVLQCPPLNDIPQANEAMHGIAHVRGETLSVLDLSHAIGKGRIPDEEVQDCFLIIAEYNKNTIAFLVRNVDRIINMQWDQIMKPPVQVQTENYLTAVFEHEERLVEILDVEQILSEMYHQNEEVTKDFKTNETLTAFAERQNILICDDSSVARRQVEKAIAATGCQVTVCNSGAEVWELISGLTDQGVDIKERFLMLISDIEMPEMDGYTLTTHIRNNEKMRDFHVTLHTSLSGGFNASMIDKVGADGFLAKFDPDLLAEEVMEQVKIKFSKDQAKA